MTLLDRTVGFALMGGLGLASGCGDDGPSGSEEGAASTTAAGSDTGTTAAAGSSGADEGTTGGDTSATTPSDTTGPVELCNGWMDDGPASPWLELYGAGHRPLVSGGTYAIDCGGQGSWMFPIFPEMGGWMLPDTTLMFSVEVVVEGFPGPTGGSFYIEPDYFYSVECFGGDDTFDGGFVHDCISVFPPDGIADLAELDGAPASIHVELEVDGGDPIVIDLVDMTLSAPADLVANECFF